MATTYYMALFLDSLLQLCRYEIVVSSNSETSYTPKRRTFQLPVLDSLNLINHPRFISLLGRFYYECELASATPDDGDKPAQEEETKES